MLTCRDLLCKGLSLSEGRPIMMLVLTLIISFTKDKSFQNMIKNYALQNVLPTGATCTAQ